MKPKTTCRVCKGRKLTKILSLGETPLANSYPTLKELSSPTEYFPLELYQCECGNVQLGVVVDPERLFKNYLYTSSTSSVFVKHFEDYAKSVVKDYSLNKGDLVVDIGSNDGILLKPFKKLGMKVVGVEPASNLAAIANKRGLHTMPYFFSEMIAKGIVNGHGKAKVVTCNNTFAHIDDLDEIIRGVKILLDKDGVFIIEVQNFQTVLRKGYFDQIYHEHLQYWTLSSLNEFFKRRGMAIIQAEVNESHGGELRVVATKRKDNCSWPKDELPIGTLKKNILKNKTELNRILTILRSEGKTVAAYGAPAKATTLMHYFGLGSDLIDFVVDDSPLKQGRFIPGKRIPIVNPAEIYNRQPDYVLITAWNFANSIRQKHFMFQGKWIIPCPTPKII